LGLSIVNGLVNLLGGEVFIESEPGKGSVFSFTLPYKPINVTHNQYVTAKEPEEFHFPNKTILIVEDDFFNAEYIQEILTGTGVTILQTIYGREALEISITQPVDLVLMDIRLPDINGYEVTRQIRKHKPELKIIAQTAYASFDERQKSFDAGCNDYISKPTNRDMLLSVVNKHLTK
jgi:CheY-like chemotaxis protein